MLYASSSSKDLWLAGFFSPQVDTYIPYGYAHNHMHRRPMDMVKGLDLVLTQHSLHLSQDLLVRNGSTGLIIHHHTNLFIQFLCTR